MTTNGAQHCSCKCHPDWSWLRFGDTKINFMDVDGLFVVERGGRFLFVEWKGPGEPLREGQRILINELSRMSAFTVLLVRGPKGAPMQYQRVDHGVFGEIKMTDRENFQKAVDRWWAIANQCALERTRQ